MLGWFDVAEDKEEEAEEENEEEIEEDLGVFFIERSTFGVTPNNSLTISAPESRTEPTILFARPVELFFPPRFGLPPSSSSSPYNVV